MGIRTKVSGARAWYPSGPRLDATSSRNDYVSAPTANPDPSNYKILSAIENPNGLVVEIQYIGCTNYEGRKILVFEKGVTLIDLVNQKLIDPHFFQNKSFKSPIARFEPTVRGMNLAKKITQ